MTGVRDTLEVTGRTMARLGFGAMRLTGPRIWGPPTNQARSVRPTRRAVECGAQHIDTADSYGLGVAEDILREALHPYPELLLIATKIGQLRLRPDEWGQVGHPAFLRHRCEMSLRRLGVECIELLYPHRIDRLGALKELQDEGKIAHIGLSEVGLDQITAARSLVVIAAVTTAHTSTSRSSVIPGHERQAVSPPRPDRPRRRSHWPGRRPERAWCVGSPAPSRSPTSRRTSRPPRCS
nr:hypothetical protein GCM10010200_100290 [Actinomadura rugatobispora]